MSAKKKKQNYNHCCSAKQYYSDETENLVKTLQITPRVIFYKHSLKLKHDYEAKIHVVNKGLHKRRLLYSADSPDITIHISPVEMANDFLPAEGRLNILVRITPKDKTRLKQRRHIYIDCKHPNIKFSIPIIILIKDEVVSIPPMITFPPTTVQNFAYYEMIIYNMTMNKLQYSVKSAPPVVVVPKKLNTISKKDYTKVLLKLDCQECQPVSGLVKLKLGTGNTYDIGFYHQPRITSIFVDTLYISFDVLHFNNEQTLEFTVCNESCTDMVYVFNFSPLEEVKLRKRITAVDFILPMDTVTGERMETIDKNPNKHFHFKPLCTTIAAFSSHIEEVTFRPVLHKDFLPGPNLPPFAVQTGLCIRPKGHPEIEPKYINLKGFISGIEIDISPKLIDLRRVYFGEEHCAHIEVQNLDVNCDAYVSYYGTTCPDAGKFLITPTDGILLKPEQRDQFTMQFYSTEFGKFMVKLKFKVKNGGIYSVVVKGFSQQARCKCFPDVVDLGNIPVALPQKRLALLRNPLTVPITVQLSIPEDGYEVPLVLNAQNVRDHLPITVDDPVYCLTQILENEYNEKPDDKKGNIEEHAEYDDEEEEEELETEMSQKSFQSVKEDCSSYSSAFEELALDHIPGISYDLVSHLKAQRVFDKHEIEKHVLEVALSELLETPYFFGMDEYKNYLQMDWNALASDPREIYCNSNEIIYLKPNAVRAVSIVVVPNVVGFHRKYIEMRVCPVMPKCMDKEQEELKQIVESDKMTSKLWVKYNCEIPEIIWDNLVIMQDELYAGQYYDFEMIFHNVSAIGGFFYYDVVPNCNLGKMSFAKNKWKFFIEPYSKLCVPCRVIFNKIGFITLSGLIKFVGVYAAYTFHIKSAIYAPKIKYSPHSIEQSINILENYSMYVFIENATPTATWFKLKVKDETVTSIEPLGAQLAPTGQIMYVTINVFYRDPGTYKNILYVIMEFETIEKIPITLHVRGMPLFFEPDIRNNNLDVGYVLCSTEEDYNQDKPNFGKTIKVINKGLCDYHIIITRTKCTEKPTCHISFVKSKITIKPNNFVIQSMSEAYFTVFINCCEPCDIFNEFRIDIADVNDMQRAITYRFTLQANLVVPQLNWSRRDITMNYFRKHKYQEHDQWELIKLTNFTQTFMESVNLKLSGPFKIKELFEHPFENELNFSMAGLETKQFFVMLDKPLIRDRTNKYYEGRITCCANSRLQRPVYLKVLMYVPEIVLKYQQVTLFTKDMEGGTFIELKNPGDVPAIYKWKKLHEEWHYVQEEDDCEQVASIVLSEIIRMLDIEPINLALDSETNLTRRYQKYKCYLKAIEDPINIKSIIYDIIDNLDLTVRRYKLCVDETDKEWECFNIRERFRSMDKGPTKESNMEIQIGEALSLELNEDLSYEWLEEHFYSDTFFMNRKFQTTSSTSAVADIQHLKDDGCAFYTLDYVINHLKLEDSYALSSPSSETCELVKSVYFFEKCGLLVENEKQYSAIHIPPIRRGYEVRAQFELDVIGGKSQLFELILVNLDKTVVLSKQNIYLGLKSRSLHAQIIDNYHWNEDQVKNFFLKFFQSNCIRALQVTHSQRALVSSCQSGPFHLIYILRPDLQTRNIFAGNDKSKPWYETYNSQFNMRNITNYQVSLNISKVQKPEMGLTKLARGYLNIIGDRKLYLPPYKSTTLKVKGIMGLNEEFKNDLRIVVNGGEELTVKFSGHGVMPMLAICKPKLKFGYQSPREIIDEYYLLQKIYYFDIFKPITEKEFDNLKGGDEEDSETFDKCLSTLAEPSEEADRESRASRSTTAKSRDICFFMLIRTYVIIENNENLPNAIILYQLLQTEKFVNYLRANKDLSSFLGLVYQNYLLHQKSYDAKMPTNLKHFTIQPLPFYMTPLILDMGQMYFNQYRKFVLVLEFLGPGKLIAACRSVVKIPGLTVDFGMTENTGNKEFVFYRYDDKLIDSNDEIYRNMNERRLDAERDPKVKHAHSYDFTRRLQHQREITPKDPKWRNYYDSLNKSIYMEQKHHIIRCKIRSNCNYNFSGTKITLTLLFKPRRANYKPNQKLEDYLYIDIHMGPTLPILLQGIIVLGHGSESSTPTSE